MHNNMSCGGLHSQSSANMSHIAYEPSGTNRFIYVKQQINIRSSHGTVNGSQKVLVNPRFGVSKVFVNPKFSGVQPNTIHVNPLVKNLKVPVLSDKKCVTSETQTSVPLQSTKIHINPNARSVQIPFNYGKTSSQTVHINPNFKSSNILNNVILNNTMSTFPVERKENVPVEVTSKAVVLTRTKLIRNNQTLNKEKIRRNSVKSRYKIIKSSLNSTPQKGTAVTGFREENKIKNRYKIDHRRRKSLSIIAKNQRKYIYVNRFLSIGDIVKNNVIKSPSKNTTINDNGVVYKKSKTSLRKTSIPSTPLIKKSPKRIISKYKFVKSPALQKLVLHKPEHKSLDITRNITTERNNLVLKKFKIVRKLSPKKKQAVKVSPKKLRKCNIPCPFYKKHGYCKGRDNGRCLRKHDPDQIALCTRFLQGACIKENCLLSHNVSPEKMPTCKYYLEGSCSKESCPYLHVKISPKADVCRDFLEGFCKKAAECNKRHQYLCPDYEKYGECLKQRCPFPHGKMVRNYLSNINKFAKKCSVDKKKTEKDQKINYFDKSCPKPETNICKNEPVKEKRYYDEKKSQTGESTIENTQTLDEVDNGATKNFIGLHSRPKLGTLPAFIPFGN